jgi:hypothetical protein
MQESKLDTWLTRQLPAVVAVILVLIPFHATLTVWLSQAVGHYTALRLWKEVLLIPLGLGAVYLLIQQRDLRNRVLSSKLTWLIAAYILVQVVWGIIAYATHQVSAKALGYGLVSDTRYLIFFLIVWVIAAKLPKLATAWPKLVFWPACAVIVFGLLQYFVLPYNFLTHLGYSSATIFPYEDINSNIHYIRIMSTLRGADPLGAYLVVILSLAVALWQKQKSWWLVLISTVGLLALIFTFSRASWIGLVLSLAVLLWVGLTSQRARQLTLIGGAAIIVIAAGSALLLRNNTTFQNVFLHTQTHSAVNTNSNQGHASALSSGLHDLLHNPIGNGPGSAGPASVYNTRAPARIAENYFIQIGQETGWIGLALFVAINGLVGYKLWQRRHHTLALGLLAALVGITFVNLLSHAWADDTLAYLWWGLAAIAYAVPPLSPNNMTKETLPNERE